jgi:uncharacterized protein HemY
VWEWTNKNEMHLAAAEGWLELGDPISAIQELEQISGMRRAKPDVLKVRLQICVRATQWENAFAIAEGLTRVWPADPEVYVWRSSAARRMKGGSLEYALNLLLEVANDFPNEPLIPFHLACYNCQLGNQMTAQSWLQIALDAAQRNGTARQWKRAALEEPDLASLRTELQNF